MKSLGIWLMNLSLLTMLVACGKKNKTGLQPGSYPFQNPYGVGAVPGDPLGNINSPYSYGGMSVNQVISQNPCRNGYGGMQVPGGQPYNSQRIPIQIPLVNFPTVIPPNDVYVGVTSWGDVGVLVGTAVGQPPLFVGYMCPRAFAPSGSGQLMGVKIGAYSRCLFKPMTAATIVFPGGGLAEFRWMDGGSSTGQRFSFCSP